MHELGDRCGQALADLRELVEAGGALLLQDLGDAPRAAANRLRAGSIRPHAVGILALRLEQVGDAFECVGHVLVAQARRGDGGAHAARLEEDARPRREFVEACPLDFRHHGTRRAQRGAPTRASGSWGWGRAGGRERTGSGALERGPVRPGPGGRATTRAGSSARTTPAGRSRSGFATRSSVPAAAPRMPWASSGRSRSTGRRRGSPR